MIIKDGWILNHVCHDRLMEMDARMDGWTYFIFQWIISGRGRKKLKSAAQVKEKRKSSPPIGV
jgi:hypothetical protein